MVIVDCGSSRGATSTATSTHQGLLDVPTSKYEEYLRSLTYYDERCPILARAISDFKRHPGRKEWNPESESQHKGGRIVVYDTATGNLETTSTIEFDVFGRLSQQHTEAELDVGNIKRPPGSGLRVVLLSWSRSAPNSSATNNVPILPWDLIDRLASRYLVDPQLFLPHIKYRLDPRNEVPGFRSEPGLPSQRPTVCVSLGPLPDQGSAAMITAQRCIEPSEPGNETVIILVQDRVLRSKISKNSSFLLSCLEHGGGAARLDPVPLDAAFVSYGFTENPVRYDSLQGPVFVSEVARYDSFQVGVLVSQIIQRPIHDWSTTTNSRQIASIMAPIARMVAAVHSDHVRDYQRFITSYPMVKNEIAPEKWMTSLHRRIFELRDATASVRNFLRDGSNGEQHPVIYDFEYVTRQYRMVQQSLQEIMSLEASKRSLEASNLSLREARISMQQNRSMKRLTQLAFVFVPLSSVASIWGMNIDLLSSSGAKWWTAVIGMIVVYLLLATVAGFLHFGPAMDSRRIIIKVLRSYDHVAEWFDAEPSDDQKRRRWERWKNWGLIREHG